ncbi:MAG: hypothetical protein WCG25_05335 [bacterium]
MIEYIKQNTDKFDSFKLFSPTFNLDKIWVKEFCNNIIENNIKISWCSTSRIDLLLDEDTIKLMAES